MIFNITEEERLYLLKLIWDINLFVDVDKMTDQDKKNFIRLNVVISDKLRFLK